MSNLQVINRDGILVVDSRLIAEEMGIEHTSLKRSIQRYNEDLTQFGDLWTDSQGVNGTNTYAEFYYLNEDQVSLILTYSNNTSIIRQLKINLIKAFKLAKERINKQQTDLNSLVNVINQLSQQLNTQQVNLNILTERTQKLDEVTQEKLELEEQLEELDQAGNENPGSWAVIQAVLNENFNIDDNYITVDQYLTSIGIQITDTTKLNIMRRRAANFYRTSKYIDPLKNKKGRNVYSGADIEYIKSAIKSVIGYIFN